MGYKQVNYQKIWSAKIYTRAELADLLGASKTTVSGWVRKGLEVIDSEEKLWLFEGRVVKKFFIDRKANKKNMKPEEFYCLSCKDIRKPIPETIEITDTGVILGKDKQTKLLIRGKCSICNNKIVKIWSTKRLIEFFQASQIIRERDHT